MRDTSRVPFALKLRALGFDREDNDRDPLTYRKKIGDRFVNVQLWKDGRHRASNYLIGRGETTLPTNFTTIEGMLIAIETETSRKDHKTF